MARVARSAWTGLLAALLLAAAGARADTLDDSLNTVWESLWDQEGTARQVMRWRSPVTYRIHGPDSRRHVAHLRGALTAVSEAAGISMVDVSAGPDAADAALDIEIVNDNDLRSDACLTEYRQVRSWFLEKVAVRMRSADVWRCGYHEVMHSMGIAGHPSGKTVLSYFPYRRDRLMELDRIMLGAWYSPRMAPGAVPLAALVVLSDAVVATQDLGLAPDAARERVTGFRQAKLKDMEALAVGRGEVPAILLRSGRAHPSNDTASQGRYAWQVGVAYLIGSVAERNAATAATWFEQGARKGYTPAQIMWARALRDGQGVDADPVAAYGWFTLAAQRGNRAAAPDLERLEEALGPERLEQARNRPQPDLAP